MHSWEDGQWEDVTLDAEIVDNTTNYARVQFDVPVKKGKWNVYFHFDGSHVVRGADGDNKNCFLGLVCYSSSRAGWSTAPAEGVKYEENYFTDFTTPCVPGVMLNGKDLGDMSSSLVEKDHIGSATINCTKSSFLVVKSPIIEKNYAFNYIKSYGAYAWLYMELGALSITFEPLADPAAQRAGQRDNQPMGTRISKVQLPSEPIPEETPVTPPKVEQTPPPVVEKPINIKDDIDPRFQAWLADLTQEALVDGDWDAPVHPPPPVITKTDIPALTGAVRRRLMDFGEVSPQRVATIVGSLKRAHNVEDTGSQVSRTPSLIPTLRGSLHKGDNNTPATSGQLTPQTRQDDDARSVTPSLTPSLRPSLLGAPLRAPTPSEAAEYKRVRDSLGKTRAEAFLRERGLTKPPSRSRFG